MTQLLFCGPGRAGYPQKPIGKVTKKRVSHLKRSHDTSSDGYIEEISQILALFQERSREPQSSVQDELLSGIWAQLSALSKKIDWSRYPYQKQEIIDRLICIVSEQKSREFLLSRTVNRRSGHQGNQISQEEGCL